MILREKIELKKTMQISQIFMTDDDIIPELPPQIQSSIDSVKNLFSDMPYKIYNNSALRLFIQENFDKEVLWAYDKLKPYAFKCDLGRYCLLYKLGGWYVDVGIKMNILGKINLPDQLSAIFFRDRQRFTGTSWACQNGIIYSKPSNPIFLECINLIVKHCKNEYYGAGGLYPTGPSVLGKAVALHSESASTIMFGDFLFLTPSYTFENTAFVLPDGMIFAWGKIGDQNRLQKSGVKGTNNYADMWERHDIYNLNL